MDGHVEFRRYPGEFPMTPKAMDLIADMESLRSTTESESKEDVQ